MPGGVNFMSHESRRRVTRVRSVSNTGILRCTVVEKVHEGILYVITY